MQNLVVSLLVALGVYLLVGLLFGIEFVFFGAKKVDPPAGETGFFFKLLILPGSMAFWPHLLRRWMRNLKGNFKGVKRQRQYFSVSG